MADKKSGEDRIDSTMITIISAVIGVIMICSFAIPVITGSAGLGALTDSQLDKYGGLVGVIVIVLIIGLIIPIVRGYNSGKR